MILYINKQDLIVLRRELKNIKYIEKEQNEQNVILFETLYNTWTYNPISTLTLCFLC